LGNYHPRALPALFRVMIAAVDEWAFNERPAGVRFLTDRIGRLGPISNRSQWKAPPRISDPR